MRIKLLSVVASVALIAGCSQQQVYKPADRDKIVNFFSRYCFRPGPGSYRECNGTPFMTYERSTGQRVIAKLITLDRETGGIELAWSADYYNHSDRVDWFYPQSSQALPGKIVSVVTMDSDYAAWNKQNEAFYNQSAVDMTR